MLTQEIDQFLAEEQIALVGVSREKSKLGNEIYRKLKEQGRGVHPVHPQMESVDGSPCVKQIGELPGDVKALMMVASPDVCLKVLADVPQTGINRVWVFPGKSSAAVDAETQRLRESGLSVVSGYCPFLFLEPVNSVHAFHRFLVRLFGKYPK